MGAGGLVMAEATHVSPEGRITPRCLGLYSNDNACLNPRIKCGTSFDWFCDGKLFCAAPSL